MLAGWLVGCCVGSWGLSGLLLIGWQAVTTPLDVAKTRQMLDVDGKTYTGMAQTLRRVASEEGAGSLCGAFIWCAGAVNVMSQQQHLSLLLFGPTSQRVLVLAVGCSGLGVGDVGGGGLDGFDGLDWFG